LDAAKFHQLLTQLFNLNQRAARVETLVECLQSMVDDATNSSKDWNTMSMQNMTTFNISCDVALPES